MNQAMREVQKRHKHELFDMIVNGEIIVRYRPGEKRPYFRAKSDNPKRGADAPSQTTPQRRHK